MRILLFLFVSFSINMSANNTHYHVYKIDDTPLAGVEIKNIKTSQQTLSDKLGYFEIGGNDSDTILFTLEGFATSELTVRNIRNSQNKVHLFPQRYIDLSEIIVMPTNMYEIYEKSISNLKKRLIVNNEFSYQCLGSEKELNSGDERELKIKFTAKLGKVKPKQRKLNYDFLLSELAIKSNVTTSQTMQKNLCRIRFFSQYIGNSIKVNDANSILITDSTIVIYTHNNPNGVFTCTINKNDTTLTSVAYESIEKDKNYTNRIRFKAKNIYSSFLINYAKTEDGYYLQGSDFINEALFLYKKSKKEERIVSMYKVMVIPDIESDSKVKFGPNTRDIYRMENYPN